MNARAAGLLGAIGFSLIVWSALAELARQALSEPRLTLTPLLVVAALVIAAVVAVGTSVAASERLNTALTHDEPVGALFHAARAAGTLALALTSAAGGAFAVFLATGL